MPLPAIPILLALIVAVLSGATVALAYWNAITHFMLDSVAPWFDANMPRLGRLVREAFAAVDRVAVAAIQVARAKWAQLKDWILQHLAEVERNSEGKWVHRVVSYFRRQLEGREPEVVKVTEEEVIRDLTMLPDEVREQLIRTGGAKINLRQKVDESLDRMELEAEA